MEIKSRLEVIAAALSEQYPRYRADPVLSSLVTDLKDYVETERTKLQKQSKSGQLTEFEKVFIAPAIQEVYLTSIDKIRRGAKPSSEMSNHIFDTSTTLDYWLFEIEDFENQKE